MIDDKTASAAQTALPRGLIIALFAAHAANTLDRQALGILLEPIRRDLLLSDVQLGILSGLTFALVFAIAAVPASLWASYGNRRTLIAVAALFWSGMMIAGGFAASFVQLLLARAGVALGEGSSIPASHAILSDIAPEDRRTGTLAMFTAAGPVGVLAAFLLGGVLGQFYGWRVAMIVAGLPGIVIGLYLLFFAREVRRDYEKPASAKEALQFDNLTAAVREIAGHAGARNALIAAALNYIVLFAALTWYPSFLVRSHGFTILQAGLIVVGGGLIGMFGTMYFGRLIDRLSLRQPGWKAWVPALTILFTTPIDLIFLLSPNRVISVAAFAVTTAMAANMIAPTAAILHSAVVPARRAIASAILIAGGALVGAGIGPAAVGWLSQHMFADAGKDSLRYALVWLQIFGVSASVFFFLSGWALSSARKAAGQGATRSVQPH